MKTKIYIANDMCEIFKTVPLIIFTEAVRASNCFRTDIGKLLKIKLSQLNHMQF